MELRPFTFENFLKMRDTNAQLRKEGAPSNKYEYLVQVAKDGTMYFAGTNIVVGHI